MYWSAGTYRGARDLFPLFWQSRLRRQWSKSKALSKEWSIWYSGTSRQVADWVQVLCAWSLNGSLPYLGLPKVHSKQAWCSNHRLHGFFFPFFWDCQCLLFIYYWHNICRLSGAALVVPFVHYWWPCFPSQLAKEAFKTLCVQDQWVFRVAYHAPWLFYWWMTQKWFPSLSIMAGNMSIFSQPDLEMLKKLSEIPSAGQVRNISHALLVYHIIWMKCFKHFL